ncbi:MAG: response regulator [Fidelibacterota bacterium]
MSLKYEVNILLVEDSPEDGEMTVRTLQKRGVVNNIIWIKDGQEGLDFFNRPPPDRMIVLLDLKLPRVNGLEILKRIKENPQTAKIPVIILTSSQENKDLEEAYRLGANSYIVKPVDFNQFSHAIHDIGHYWLLLNKIPYDD